MSEDKDGGPAFPTKQTIDCHDHVKTIYHDGMTLRDYMAAAALTGLMRGKAYLSSEDIAIDAYRLANCMIAARGEK